MPFSGPTRALRCCTLTNRLRTGGTGNPSLCRSSVRYLTSYLYHQWQSIRYTSHPSLSRRYEGPLHRFSCLLFHQDRHFSLMDGMPLVHSGYPAQLACHMIAACPCMRVSNIDSTSCLSAIQSDAGCGPVALVCWASQCCKWAGLGMWDDRRCHWAPSKLLCWVRRAVLGVLVIAVAVNLTMFHNLAPILHPEGVQVCSSLT